MTRNQEGEMLCKHGQKRAAGTSLCGDCRPLIPLHCQYSHPQEYALPLSPPNPPPPSPFPTANPPRDTNFLTSPIREPPSPFTCRTMTIKSVAHVSLLSTPHAFKSNAHRLGSHHRMEHMPHVHSEIPSHSLPAYASAG